MNNIIKIVIALAYSGILLKSVPRTIEHETKGQTGRFSGMLLRSLGAILLGNMLEDKGFVTARCGNKEQL